MEDTGNNEVMDEKLLNAAKNGDLLSFVQEARNNELESGRSEEYFLSQTSYSKENILHLAIQYMQHEFIEKVLKGGQLLPRAVTDQLIKQQDKDGNTPLHVAAVVGNIDILKLALDYDHNQAVVKNGDGNTPLHVAVYHVRVKIVKLLLEHHHDELASVTNNVGNTPLHVAAWVGNFKIFKLVLDYDHNQAVVKNEDGNTPLHVAVLKFKDVIATLLLNLPSEQIIRVTNNMKETPLHLAIEQYRQIIHLPLKKRKALGSAYLGMIKLMIEKESCVACWQDATGATPLHRAASITSTYTLQIIRLMLNHCPQSVEVCDSSSKTILHLLKTIPSYKEAKDLLGVTGLLGLINHQDNQGNTPLHWAAMNLNHNMVRALLDFSVEQSIQNSDGITAKALIQEQFEVIMEKKPMTMEVCEATERADVTFLKERLHQFGMIFLFPRDSKRRNVLHKLMQMNSRTALSHTDFVDFIQQVLEWFPELICQVDHNGDTPLHILMQNSPDTMIRLVSESYDYVVLPLSDSSFVQDLLHLFCSYSNRAQEEASVKGDHYDLPWLVQNAVGNTPIHEALRVNHGKEVVKRLIELDIEITARLMNNLNETPLHLLVEHPREEEMVSVIEGLVVANAEVVYTYDKFGQTPILRAAQHGKVTLISELYMYDQSTAYVGDEKYGQTMWHLLLKTLPYNTKYLLKNHSELRRGLIFKDYNGQTPLHLAIEGRHFEHAINFLRDADTEEMRKLLESKNVAGITPSDLIRSSQEFPNELQELLKNHLLVVGIRSVWDVPTSQIQEYANTMGVVAALITTITFTAAFTVPGGNIEGNKGFPALIREAAFQAFMISNILAMCLSTMVLFCLLWVIATTDKSKSVVLMDFSLLLLLLSLYATLFAFMMGVYVTTIHTKPWIAVITLVLCSLLMLLMHKNLVMDYLVPAVGKGFGPVDWILKKVLWELEAVLCPLRQISDSTELDD